MCSFLFLSCCRMSELAEHKDLDLIIEEDLVAYCTTELQAFASEEDGGLEAVHKVCTHAHARLV